MVLPPKPLVCVHAILVLYYMYPLMMLQKAFLSLELEVWIWIVKKVKILLTKYQSDIDTDHGHYGYLVSYLPFTISSVSFYIPG